MLKSYRWVGWGGWGGWVAHEILVLAQGPLVLGLGLKGLGLRVWGQGLTIVEGGACVYGNPNILALLEHGGLPHVLPLAAHLKFVWSIRVDNSEILLLFGMYCCLKVIVGGLGV